MATLRRKGRYWYLRSRSEGRDTEVATGCTDRKAAEAWQREWERDRAEPGGDWSPADLDAAVDLPRDADPSLVALVLACALSRLRVCQLVTERELAASTGAGASPSTVGAPEARRWLAARGLRGW